jgi:glycosyltransferase involved in cell wall biosynthesis
MKLLMVSDSWPPFVSGFVRTLVTTVDHLRKMGHEVEVVSPDQFWTIPCPVYPQLPLAIGVRRKVERLIESSSPDAIHLAAEGPLSWATRAWCLRNGVPFTSSYTTNYPEYLHTWLHVPRRLTYTLLRQFHRYSSAVMVSTESLAQQLKAQGFHRLVRWTRGVDLELFRPRSKEFLSDARPTFLCVGRVGKEKNLAAFLDLKIAGTKYVVGDGPQLGRLKKRYPSVRFVGVRHGEELARYYAAADVLVFPSRTDTFGLVLLESLASGVPVAAYPVPGPLDVIGNSGVGVLSHDLEFAVSQALTIPARKCRSFAERFTWDASVRQFLDNLAPVPRATLSMSSAPTCRRGSIASRRRAA